MTSIGSAIIGLEVLLSRVVPASQQHRNVEAVKPAEYVSRQHSVPVRPVVYVKL